MILIVFITKLITLSSITIQILQLNNLVFSNSYPFRERLSLIFAAKLLLQKDTTSPKVQKCFKKNYFFYIFLKYWLYLTHFQRFGCKKRRKLLPASSHISYCVFCLPVCLSVYLFPTLLLFVQLVPFSSPQKEQPLFSLFPRVPQKGTSYAFSPDKWAIYAFLVIYRFCYLLFTQILRTKVRNFFGHMQIYLHGRGQRTNLVRACTKSIFHPFPAPRRSASDAQFRCAVALQLASMSST